MTYEKPQVALIASAIETIKASKDDIQGDNGALVSVSAYQADE